MSTDQLHFTILTERPVVRSDQTTDLDVAVQIVTSKSIGTQSTNHAINLCIVLDRSGSMGGDKLDQAKRSCVDIYNSLNTNDRFTMLAFDTEVISVVNPQTPQNQITERILGLESGGSTDLSKGWYLGLLELQTYSTDQHIHRLILLSDGQANAGEQKSSVLGAESNRARDELGITTSTIGVGADFQEDILAALAHASGGRFWFIGEARIEDIIKEEFSGALSVLLERPSVDLVLPPGVTIVRELNDLPKISGRYRIRPLKANDQFAFAVRLRIDPAAISDHQLRFTSTLFDGAGLVQSAETTVRLGSVEEYVQSTDDARVATVVRKYLAATSDEKMIDQMDAGNITTMLEMLRSQSDLMKELEAKLAGATAVSWEEMTEREKAHRERELARLEMEIGENEALAAVGQLVDLMQGLGLADRASRCLAESRKMHRQRGMRNMGDDPRGEMDDWAVRSLLATALSEADELIVNFPDLADELTALRRSIDEQLVRFS